MPKKKEEELKTEETQVDAEVETETEEVEEQAEAEAEAEVEVEVEVEKEKKYRVKSTIAEPERTIGMGCILTLPDKIAKKLIEEGLIEEYKGKMKPNAVYEKAVEK